MGFHSTLRSEKPVSSGSGLQNANISSVASLSTPRHRVNEDHNLTIYSQISSGSIDFSDIHSTFNGAERNVAELEQIAEGEEQSTHSQGDKSEDHSSDAPQLGETTQQALKDISFEF